MRNWTKEQFCPVVCNSSNTTSAVSSGSDQAFPVVWHIQDQWSQGKCASSQCGNVPTHRQVWQYHGTPDKIPWQTGGAGCEGTLCLLPHVQLCTDSSSLPKSAFWIKPFRFWWERSCPKRFFLFWHIWAVCGTTYSGSELCEFFPSLLLQPDHIGPPPPWYIAPHSLERQWHRSLPAAEPAVFPLFQRCLQEFVVFRPGKLPIFLSKHPSLYFQEFNLTILPAHKL